MVLGLSWITVIASITVRNSLRAAPPWDLSQSSCAPMARASMNCPVCSRQKRSRRIISPCPSLTSRVTNGSKITSASSSPRLNRAISTGGGESVSLKSDRKSTRLNSSHDQISYAVFCLKKKKKRQLRTHRVCANVATASRTAPPIQHPQYGVLTDPQRAHHHPFDILHPHHPASTHPPTKSPGSH